MKLQFKHQKFQADAAKAVVDVFAGQPYLTPTYMMDRGTGIFQIGMNEEDDFTGWRNQPLVPELSKRMILEQIQEIQRIYQITPSQKLEGEGYNLTIEMETGVGKTYTYIKTIGSIYDPKTMQPENARSNNVELHVDEEKIAMPEFKALWSKINAKSVYIVDFDTDELVQKAIASLDAKLRVAKIFFKVESGVMEEIKSKEALESGAAFIKETSASYGTQTRISVNSSVKYDLVGKLVEETKLTRKDIIAILRGIQKPVFEQFKDNPEEFIIKAAALINDEKATAIIQHITYDVLDERYGTEVFTDPTIRGKLGVNAMKAKKHLYDHVVFDSTNERDFAAELDTNTDVAVYVKLPDGFYISTPVGHYNPETICSCNVSLIRQKQIYFLPREL